MWLKIYPDELQLEARSLDCSFWSHTLDKHPSVRKRMPRRSDKVIGGDLFNLLYKFDPEVVGEPSDAALSAWLKSRLELPEFQEIRTRTVGDKHRSALTAVRLFQELMRPKDSTFKAVAEAKSNRSLAATFADDNEQAAAAVEAIKSVQENLGEMIKEQTPDTEGMFKDGEGAYEAAKFAQALHSADEGVEAMEQFIATAEGFETSSQTDRLIELGLDENLMGTFKGQESFRKIMEAAGRIRLLAGEIKSRKPKPVPQPVGLTQGSKLEDVVPQELAFADDPELADLFDKRFHEGSLTLYDRKQKEIEGRGPIVACLDVSGSMTGTKDTWARAMLLQFARTAKEQGRGFAWLPFATHAGNIEEVTSAKNLVDMLVPRSYRSLGGGTQFHPPMYQSISFIEDQKVWENADVLFLSDGDSRISASNLAQLLKLRDQVGCKIIGALFGASWWRSDTASLLDASIVVKNPEDVEWQTELLARIV